jgi:hypothetical protein
LRYYDIGNLALHGICNSGIKNCGYWPKICLRYYGIEYPPMPPSRCGAKLDCLHIYEVLLWYIPIVLFGFGGFFVGFFIYY